MKHRTKQWLILLYTVLTVASVALVLSSVWWNMIPFGFAWPEMMSLAFLSGWSELTVLGMIINGTLFAAMLLHVAAPLCGFFRIYTPFKVLLCVKAVLSVAAFMLLPGAYSGVLLAVHGALFILAAVFFRRDEPAAAPADVAPPAPADVLPPPSQGLRMPGGGFPDR